MTRIETAEQARVWLATYEAANPRRGTRGAIEEADGAVEAWRERVGAVVERVKAVVAERNSLQEDLAAMKERIAALEKMLEDAEMECLVGGPGRTLSERVRGMRLLMAEQANSVAALEKSVEVAESLRAACHKDLAAVREALGGHNNPELSVAECAKALTKRVDVLRETLAELAHDYHVAILARDNLKATHTEPWPTCQNVTCRQAREVLGEEWPRARESVNE